MKNAIADHLRARGVEPRDYGARSEQSVDYVRFAEAVARSVASGECELGILVCGTGIGMSVAANKIRGVRAALCTDAYMAQMSREHNDANVLALGARVVGIGLARDIVDRWLEARFLGGKHEARVSLVSLLESNIIVE
jgi:ribose 5-phosphate isomerase B